MDQQLLDGVQAFRTTVADNMSEAEAIRRIIRDWLSSHGYLRASDEGLPPDQLTTENDG